MNRFLAGIVAVALAAVAVAVAACGGDDETQTTTVTAAATETPATTPDTIDEDSTTSGDDTATATAPEEAAGGGTPGDDAGDAGRVSPGDDEVLASTETTIAGVPMRIDVTELVRQDELATLSFTVTNTSPRDSETFYHAFDNSGRGTAVDGVLLIDPKSGQEHRVLTRHGEGCLCSDELPFTLGPHETVSLFATYKAPPGSPTSANVSFPGSGGTLTGIPISEG